MNDYAMYDLAKQRYADVLKVAEESRRPRRLQRNRGQHRLAVFAQLLVSRKRHRRDVGAEPRGKGLLT